MFGDGTRARLRLGTLVALAFAFASGCSSRDHLNPLDPANAVTHGAPQGFAALAGDGQVFLAWQSPSTGRVVGYRVFRGAGAAAPESLMDLPLGVTTFLDGGLTNGVDYAYRLAYRLDDGALSSVATDIATPGPARPWIVDYGARALERLTPDGRHVAETITDRLQTPSSLDIVGGPRIFVCDPTAGVLWRVTSAFQIEEWGSLVEPVAVAADRARGRVWVCDQGQGALQSIDALNTSLVHADIRGLATPLDVAVDPTDGSAWACERTGDRVRHVSADGAALGSAIAASPSRVAVDSVTRRIWVSSFTSQRVTVFAPTGAPVDTLTGLVGPVGVAIDPIAGRIWVADPSADRVLAFDRAGQLLFRVDGLPQPVDLSVDRRSGEAWVVLPAAGQVARIAPDGRVLRRLGGFSTPNDVAVE